MLVQGEQLKANRKSERERKKQHLGKSHSLGAVVVHRVEEAPQAVTPRGDVARVLR